MAAIEACLQALGLLSFEGSLPMVTPFIVPSRDVVGVKFFWVNMSSTSDASVFNGLSLKQMIDAGMLGMPKPDVLPNDVQDTPYVFVGDDTFALRPSMMKPYYWQQLTNDERIFNYRRNLAETVR